MSEGLDNNPFDDSPIGVQAAELRFGSDENIDAVEVLRPTTTDELNEDLTKTDNQTESSARTEVKEVLADPSTLKPLSSEEQQRLRNAKKRERKSPGGDHQSRGPQRLDDRQHRPGSRQAQQAEPVGKVDEEKLMRQRLAMFVSGEKEVAEDDGINERLKIFAGDSRDENPRIHNLIVQPTVQVEARTEPTPAANTNIHAPTRRPAGVAQQTAERPEPVPVVTTNQAETQPTPAAAETDRTASFNLSELDRYYIDLVYAKDGSLKKTVYGALGLVWRINKWGDYMVADKYIGRYGVENLMLGENRIVLTDPELKSVRKQMKILAYLGGAVVPFSVFAAPLVGLQIIANEVESRASLAINKRYEADKVSNHARVSDRMTEQKPEIRILSSELDRDPNVADVKNEIRQARLNVGDYLKNPDLNIEQANLAREEIIFDQLFGFANVTLEQRRRFALNMFRFRAGLIQNEANLDVPAVQASMERAMNIMRENLRLAGREMTEDEFRILMEKAMGIKFETQEAEQNDEGENTGEGEPVEPQTTPPVPVQVVARQNLEPNMFNKMMIGIRNEWRTNRALRIATYSSPLVITGAVMAGVYTNLSVEALQVVNSYIPAGVTLLVLGGAIFTGRRFLKRLNKTQRSQSSPVQVPVPA